MYQHTIDEMIHDGVAEKLRSPVWMDSKRNLCCEVNTLGFQVSHRLIHADICLFGDEVGGNISMKGDGHAGGQLLITERGSVP